MDLMSNILGMKNGLDMIFNELGVDKLRATFESQSKNGKPLLRIEGFQIIGAFMPKGCTDEMIPSDVRSISIDCRELLKVIKMCWRLKVMKTCLSVYASTNTIRKGNEQL